MGVDVVITDVACPETALARRRAHCNRSHKRAVKKPRHIRDPARNSVESRSTPESNGSPRKTVGLGCQGGPVPQCDTICVRYGHRLLGVVRGRHDERADCSVVSHGSDGVLHRLVANQTVPATNLDDHAPMAIIEEKPRPEFPATSDASYSIPLAGKEVLEQVLELSFGHRVNGRHTRSVIRVAPFRSPTPQSRHARDDERRRAQQDEGGANLSQCGTKDKQECADDGDAAGGMTTERRTEGQRSDGFPPSSATDLFVSDGSGLPTRVATARVGRKSAPGTEEHLDRQTGLLPLVI